MAKSNTTNTQPDTAKLVVRANALRAYRNRAKAAKAKRNSAICYITIEQWRESLYTGRDMSNMSGAELVAAIKTG